MFFQLSARERDIRYHRLRVKCWQCCFLADHGLTADTYATELEGSKKTAKRVEEKFTAKMKQINVRVHVIHSTLCFKNGTLF